MISTEELRTGGAVKRNLITPPTREREPQSGTGVRPEASALNLRAGEWVEVLSAGEILQTLDDSQSLDGLPFMPEMLQYCGKRFRVYKSAHKTCDTIEEYAIRRMVSTVHLEGLRCDGADHGGCDAACLLFWREAWLKRVSGAESRPNDSRVSEFERDVDTARRTLQPGTRQPTPEGETGDRYRCQTTELLRATTEVRRRDRWSPLFYLRDLTTRNVQILDFVRYGLLAMFNAFSLRWRGRRYPDLRGLAGTKTPRVDLNLQPGELVEVKSKEEIMQTLDGRMRNRGLLFDVEMVRFCGHRFRVLRKVERILNEKTGRMMTMPNPCLILDSVTCSGNISSCRMFCPRAIYPYWHEVWLKRVEPDKAPR